MRTLTWRRLLAHARVHAPWRRLFPRRPVFREVQGVGLWMPWSHRLPDYVGVNPEYGQNLVDLAAAIAEPGRPLQVLDVGANIGDSTRQILDRTPARVLAVEADTYYLDYLRRNVDDRPEVTVADVLLTVGDDIASTWSPVRRGGTTHFVAQGEVVAQQESGLGVETQSVAGLRQRHPEFGGLRLIKSDTDGFDTELVPALAAEWSSTRPVLFFEFDPRLTRQAAGLDAHDVWAKLADLGYDCFGFWSHSGEPLRRTDAADAGEVSRALLCEPDAAVAYLDVVAVHADDPAGRSAVDTLLAQHP